MKRFINTKVVIDIATDQILSREGFEYEGPMAEAVAATAVTRIAENPSVRGGKEEWYSFAIDVGSLTISTQEVETIAVTGARTGDPCWVSLESPQAGVVAQGAKVTANDVVSFYMGATVSIDPTAMVGYLHILKRAIAS